MIPVDNDKNTNRGTRPQAAGLIHVRRLWVALALTVLAAPALRAAEQAPAVPAPQRPLLSEDIPRQTLQQALDRFTELTGLLNGSAGPITGEIAARESPGAKRGSTPLQVLQQLLAGAPDLRFEFVTSRMFKISEAVPVVTEPARPAEPQAMEEVEVTARRHAEPVGTVPLSITVVTQKELLDYGIKGTADIGQRVPGMEYDFLSYVGAGVYTNMAIRGVTDRHGTVTEIFLDDIPIPEVRSNTFGRALPASFDLERTEVLRGPQGTIMGPNTQGGAIRYVPNRPSLRGDSGGLETEWATTEWGRPTYEVGTWLDRTLVDNSLGVRLSGWYRSDGGYVNRVDPFSCEFGLQVVPAVCAVKDADADRVTSRSFRGSLTYAPTEALRISPAVTYEANSARDASVFFTYLSDPGAGRFSNGSLIPQPAFDQFYLSTLKVAADLGSDTTLTGVTAYFDRTGGLTVDDTESIGWAGWGNVLGLEYPLNYGDTITSTIHLTQRMFSQELRLGSRDQLRSVESDPGKPSGVTPEAPLSWFAAVSYSGQRYRESGSAVGPYRVLQFPVPFTGDLDSQDTTTTVQDRWAVFGDVTRRIGPHFAVNGGLRLERDDYDAHDTGLAGYPVFRQHAAETLAVPRIALSYEVDRQSSAHVGTYLLYLSAAKGYSPAGVDAALATCFLPPLAFPADTLWTYELGGKSALLDNRLSLNLAAFHSLWDNGPTPTGNCLFRHMPGSATSNGFELETHVTPARSFRAGLQLSYTDSHYTQTVTDAAGDVYVHAGDAVGTPPLVTSPWNVRATLEQDLQILGHSFALRAEDIFHSRNPGPFYTNEPDSIFYAPRLAADPSTNILNLRMALTRGALQGQLFLNNALGSQPTLLRRNKGDDILTLRYSTLYYATTLRPRTLGVSVQWQPQP